MAKYYPLVQRRVVEVEVPIGDGGRDVSFEESFDIGDQLAGTLGPVQTEDSVDLSDSLVAGPWVVSDTVDLGETLVSVSGPQFEDSVDFGDQLAGTLGPVQTQDSVDFADSLVAGPWSVADTFDIGETMVDILGPQLLESVNISDSLAGTLGPIIAPDTLDVSDDPVMGPLVLGDSFDIGTAHAVDLLSATALDTVDLGDHPNDIIGPQVNESVSFAESLVYHYLDPFLDGFDASDNLIPSGVASAPETFDLGDVAFVTLLTTSDPEPVDFDDKIGATDTVFPDSVGVGDDLPSASISGVLWPDTVESSSVFSNTGNFVDTSTSSVAHSEVSQSGGLVNPSSQNASPAITVSFPDPDVSLTPTMDGDVTLTYDWASSNDGGLLVSGQAVSMTPAYSLNDGSSWTNLTTITNAGGSATETVDVTMTWAQFLQLRFRWTGTITSGTVALGLGTATQNFDVGYVNADFAADTP